MEMAGHATALIATALIATALIVGWGLGIVVMALLQASD